MSTKQDGGPAFPQHGWTKDPEILKRMQESGMGMTLRDWFAGQAMSGAISSDRWYIYFTCGNDNPDASALELAKASYRVADAMLKARGA